MLSSITHAINTEAGKTTAGILAGVWLKNEWDHRSQGTIVFFLDLKENKLLKKSLNEDEKWKSKKVRELMG